MFKFYKRIKYIKNLVDGLNIKLDLLSEKVDGMNDFLSKKRDDDSSRLIENINAVNDKISKLEKILLHDDLLFIDEILAFCQSEINREEALEVSFEHVRFFRKQMEKFERAGKIIGFEVVEGTPCLFAHDFLHQFNSFWQKLNLDKEKVIQFLNKKIFFPYQIEFVHLGLLVKTFRFWTIEEKHAYINNNLKLIEILQKKYPLSFFSYGTALGATRGQGLIPHDFDMDISVVVPSEMTTNIFDATKMVANYLTDHGYIVDVTPSGCNMHVVGPDNTFFDIWVAAQNDDYVNWNPSPRDEIRLDMIEPLRSDIMLEGIHVPLPCQVEKYLEIMYGQDWKIPKSAWDRPGNYVYVPNEPQ